MENEKLAHRSVSESAPRHDLGSHDARPFVRFVGVQKNYGAFQVVKDLNLDIHKGEFLTLLGPSGSGKTTTLMMLAGFENATDGEILIDDRPITQLPPHRRGIGVVFQSYALFPHMTIAQNLAFPLEVRGMDRSEIAGRVGRALEMVELPGVGGRRPAQLSGGQQQRIALARALIFEPPMVLLDEPLGALDKHLREQMQYEIKELHRKLGITMVYVTHDQSEALTMSDRVAVFDHGRIQQLCDPETLYREPGTAFVASFIGENNPLSGSLHTRGADGMCVVKLKSGEMVQGAACDTARPGDNVTVFVRPECVELGGSEQGIYGTISDIVFHGDHVRCLIETAGTKGFIYKSSSRSRVDLSKGSNVSLSWSPRNARVLRSAVGAEVAKVTK